MTLRQILDAIAVTAKARASPRGQRAGEACLQELRDDGLVDGAVQVGGQLPSFVLPDADGRIRRMHEFLATGLLVVSFFRGNWCPFCQAELKDLQDHYQAIRARGADLVAISPQTPVYAAIARQRFRLTFPVLSDIGNAYAREVGLVFHLPEDLRDVYRDEYHIDLRCFNGDLRDELPVPATYILDRHGRVIARGIDVDYSRRMEPGAILAALDAHADQVGCRRLCPW